MLQDLVILTAGIIVGGMNAIAGGGMLIGFPLLVAMGVPPLIANATGALVTIPGQLTSAYGYRAFLRNVPKKYAFLLIPCVLGAIAGALTLRYTPADNFDKLVPALVLFGVVLFAVQPFLHLHLHRHVLRRSRALAPLVILALCLLPITFYGGYFGAGFGFLMLAFLGFTSLRESHTMNALKNIAAAFVAATSVICLFSANLIDWHIGLIMAAGCAVGGYLGAHSAQKVSSHLLRAVIICVGLAAAIYLGVSDL